MRFLKPLFFLMLTFPLLALGQEKPNPQASQNLSNSPLDVKIGHFDLDDAILRDGLSKLSQESVDGLHLGFEEIIRGRIQDDPRALSPHFSLHLTNTTVRKVLDALCENDIRYAWSDDGVSTNVYPRATENDSSYLLNLRIDHIAVSGIPDPDQALTSLSNLFPEQQIGYFGPGLGDNSYAEPWTASFERLTVRQFINRIAEHMGPHTSWVWEGGKKERMFVFVKGGFNSSRSDRSEWSPSFPSFRAMLQKGET